MRSEKVEPKAMRKNSGRSSSFGQNFFLFLLVIVAGYDTYETIQLKAEISELRGRRHTVSSPRASAGVPTDGNSSSLFAQARDEIGQAQAKLHLKDYSKARADLQQGVASLERANTQARTEGEKVLAELRTAAQSLQDKSNPPANPSRDSTNTASKDTTRKPDRESQ